MKKLLDLKRHRYLKCKNPLYLLKFKKGSVISREDLDIKSPGGGLPPIKLTR